MKLTLKQLVEGSQALSRLASEKVSGKLAYSIARNIRIVQPELDSYEKARVALVESGGVKNDAGDMTIPPEGAKQFLKELEELQAEEIDLDVRTIVLPETFQISSADLFVLEWMLKIEGAE